MMSRSRKLGLLGEGTRLCILVKRGGLIGGLLVG